MNKNPIGKYIRQSWYMYLIALLSMFAGIALDLCAPFVTKHIIDDVIVGGRHELLTRYLLAFLGIAAGKAVFQYTKEYLFDISSVEIAAKMRKNLFIHLQKLSIRYFDKTNTGEILARLKDDVERVWDALGFVGMLVIEGVIHVISIIICMVRLSPYLTLVPLAILPFIGYIAIKLEKQLGDVYDAISEQNAELNTVAQENLSGVRTVKAFARENFEIRKFMQHNKRYYDLNMEQARILIKYDPNITFLTRMMLVLVLLLGGFLVITGSLSIGGLGAFMEYANNILWPFENLGWLSNSLASAMASNRKINKILEEVPEIAEPLHPVSVESLQGNLEFKDVSFSLHGNKILEDISFTVEKGKTLGVMGMTGSGKTTIVNLIERFYDVDRGEVLLDGVDIRQLPLEAVRKCSSVVMQDVFLFSDTIEENVRLGSREEMDSETIREAARVANASEFIERMSEQYLTVVGERGVGLSGGQKQRLSIARALAKPSPILILDDSTSALDMETEYQIQQELTSQEGRSKIIIAHRISAVKSADEILVLDQGRIVERGTHEELMKHKGFYYSTYEAQYGDYHKAMEIMGKEGFICQ
ncbi:ABC transporter ATP-binding protein [Novisyntrophococcus fermenticellae]|uniref:ABC transporter ATP-binding protein n=1 Tax=Novisyntrophococcus fermenticellae TaxID=2068655 RepID=UPI002E76D280|nr:ABC transporter ATP-binding protein [Novisyntrophococcus fermenticellae]